MTQVSRTGSGDVAPSSPSDTERIFVLSDDQLGRVLGRRDEAVVLDFLKLLWTRRHLVLVSMAIFTLMAAGYAFAAREWWRVEILMSPTEELGRLGTSAPLGGLAELAGVRTASRLTTESMAVLRSKDFARHFILTNDLEATLIAEDMGLISTGLLSSWGNGRARDLEDAVAVFREEVLSVSQDSRTQLVTVAIEWTDAKLAAAWAQEVFSAINTYMRERELQKSEKSVAYLQELAAGTAVSVVNQAAGRLIERELQTVVLAKRDEDFVFSLIDGAAIPREPSRPKRLLAVALGILVGAFVGASAALLGNLRDRV